MILVDQNSDAASEFLLFDFDSETGDQLWLGESSTVPEELTLLI